MYLWSHRFSQIMNQILYCATLQGRNPYNIWFIFWKKWWLHKFILKFTDLYQEAIFIFELPRSSKIVKGIPNILKFPIWTVVTNAIPITFRQKKKKSSINLTVQCSYWSHTVVVLQDCRNRGDSRGHRPPPQIGHWVGGLKKWPLYCCSLSVHRGWVRKIP